MANIWYVDSSMPDDTGDGLSPATAFKNWNTARAKLNRTEGQILRVRGGRYYGADTLGSGVGGFVVSNVTIEPYGESGNPCIDGITWLAPASGGWTLEGPADAGGQVWSIQLGTSAAVARVYAASTNGGILLGQRVLGEALRRAPDTTFGGITATADNLTSIKANLNQNDAWYGAGSALTYKLYMWTPSTLQDPSLYYQGIGLVQSGAGTLGITSAFSLVKTQNFRVNNIDIRGASSFSVQIAVVDTETMVNEDITFYQCKSSAALQHFRASQVSTAAYLTVIRKVEFRECIADTYSSAKEQEINQAYSKLSAADQFRFEGKIADVRAVDCVSIDNTHAALALGAYDSVNALPRRTGFLRHTVRAASYMAYSRSINMNMCEPSCYVTNCTFIGQNTVAQINGSGRVTGNRWLGMRKYIRKPSTPEATTDGWVAFSGFRIDQGNATIGIDRYLDLRPEGLLFAHNSCDGCYGTPVEVDIFGTSIGIGSKSLTPIKENSLFFINNLMIDTNPERVGKPYLTTYNDPSITMTTQTFANNLIYNGTGSPSSAKWAGVTYASLHDAPGHSGNITANPKVDADLVPSKDSPAISAGLYTGTLIDHIGKRFGVKPTIGAFEVKGQIVRKAR